MKSTQMLRNYSTFKPTDRTIDDLCGRLTSVSWGTHSLRIKLVSAILCGEATYTQTTLGAVEVWRIRWLGAEFSLNSHSGRSTLHYREGTGTPEYAMVVLTNS